MEPPTTQQDEQIRFIHRAMQNSSRQVPEAEGGGVAADDASPIGHGVGGVWEVVCFLMQAF